MAIRKHKRVKNEIIVVKYKKINRIGGEGKYSTKDELYKLNYPIKKIIKICLKCDFSFKVGVCDSLYTNDKQFIEITDDSWLYYLPLTPYPEDDKKVIRIEKGKKKFEKIFKKYNQ